MNKRKWECWFEIKRPQIGSQIGILCPKGIFWHTNIWVSVFKLYIWSEEFLDIIFYSTQNPLQCSFHILSILYMNGNRLGRRAAVLHRRLQESHGFQEMQVLQEMHPEVGVWAWCLKEGSYHWIRSHSVSLSMCNWKLLDISAPVICTDSVLALPSSNIFTLSSGIGCLGFCTGRCWFLQQCKLSGRYEIQLFLFQLKNISWKEGSEFPRLSWEERFHTVTIFGDTHTLFVHVPQSVLIRIVAAFSFYWYIFAFGFILTEVIV